MTDREKLNAFENWLQDDEGQEKGNRYHVISVLVQSGEYNGMIVRDVINIRWDE